MARFAAALIDDVLARVRDVNGLATTRTFVRERLTDSQRYLNALLGLSLDAADLTLNPHQSIYQINTLLPSAQRIVGIRGGGGQREIATVPSIASLLIFGPTWMRHTGHRVEAWTTVGRDLLVVYPTLKTGQVYTVWYAKLCLAFGTESTLTEFANEYTDLITTLTEAVVLLRQRDLGASSRAMERLAKQIAPEMAATRLHAAPVVAAPPPAKGAANE